jgi:UDP-N-acetylglucosamine--N-acetylmuramyl-(pentapeptide) pyrophosphoryl-undecaprenol N-acetylglucosamine transferase
VLVPSPNVAEDHQRHNAEALARKDAAVMILDADCQARLADTVSSLLADAPRREALGRNAAAMALTGSADKIVDQALALLS